MTEHESKKKTRSIVSWALYLASFIPLLLLIITFGGHAAMAFMGHPEIRQVVELLGFGLVATGLLVLLTGVHDTAVVVALLGMRRLFPRAPWWPLFLYAALWPIIPRLIIWSGGARFEWEEVGIFMTLTLLAYIFQVARTRLFAA